MTLTVFSFIGAIVLFLWTIKVLDSLAIEIEKECGIQPKNSIKSVNSFKK